MPNLLNEKEKKTVGDVLKKHLQGLSEVEVILFGSLASGRARPKSDIDIAVKAKGPLDKAVWAKIEAEFEESDLSREVDVVDYWRVNPEFRKVIDESGEKILVSKSHPYRLCPTGYHWVRTHLREVPPSQSHPSGGLTEVDGHCRVNRSSGVPKSARELLTADEIGEMFRRFGKGKGTGLGRFRVPEKKDWNRFDDEISFWTEFWNDTFDPKEKLDPNLVKALIGSESSFRLNPGKPDAGEAGQANGLIQLTDQALAALSGDKNEVQDYCVKINRSDLHDANMSVAGGIRWLFHKRTLASNLLKREATWKEAVMAYKGYLNNYKKDPKTMPKGIKVFEDNYAELNSRDNSR